MSVPDLRPTTATKIDMSGVVALCEDIAELSDIIHGHNADQWIDTDKHPTQVSVMDALDHTETLLQTALSELRNQRSSALGWLV